MADRDEIKEQIRDRADIVDIVGEVLPLKRRGKNFVGLCPFHDEKTPSFTVFPDRNVYKCFGCGKAGDVFGFLMDYHSMSFPEAIEFLGRRLGIELPKKGKPTKDSIQKLEKKEAAFKALAEASSLYGKILMSKQGKIALDYFHRRGFSDKLIKDFALGYSLDAWEGMSGELRKRGFSDKALIDAGLVVEKEGGRIYDRFRGRPMFPIRDYIGRVIGFGARKLKEDDPLGKYINSPQSPVYDKSRSIYGLFEAKNALRNKDEAILVEGYADVLSLHQAGFDNAVASSGTALTPEQLKILKRFCSRLILVYDADEAGIKAAGRALEPAVAEGFEVFVAVLPEGEDPDSIVRDRGPEEFERFIQAARNFIDFKVWVYEKSGKLDSPGAKANAAKEILAIINKLADSLKQGFYVSYLADALGMNEIQTKQLYEEKQRQQGREKQSGYDQKITNEEKSFRKIIESIRPEEYLLIYLIINNEEALNQFSDSFDSEDDMLVSEEGKRLFGLILSLAGEGNDMIREIMANEAVSQKDRDVLTEIALNHETPSRLWKEFGPGIPETDIMRNISDIMNRIEIQRIDQKLQNLNLELKNSDNAGKQLSMLQEISLLTKRKEDILSRFDSHYGLEI